MFDNGSASNVAVTNDKQLWRPMVAYEHDNVWLRSNSPTDQTVGDDMFTFKVFDSHWNYSVPAAINITVLSGVSAISKKSVQWCFEEVNCEVELFGSTKSDSVVNMSITITGLPMYGNLFDSGTNMPVEVGSILSSQVKYPYDSGASVVYQPEMDVFTDPATQWNGTQLPELGDIILTFYASIELGGTRIFSPEVSQELKVRNVNDNSTIRCGDTILQTQAAGVVDDDDIILDDVRPDRLFIYNFSITEKDQGVDPVRVSVTVESGYLTLNDTLRSRVSFGNPCSGTYDWRCRGDGVFNQNMVFIGAPEDVQHVLNGMLYVSYTSNAMDNMTVTIQDGFEGDCIWEFTTFSLRPTCHSSSCSIMINVTETWLGDDRGEALLTLTLAEFFALFALVSALGGLIVWYCLKSVTFFLCFCCRRRRRRSKGVESKKMEVAATAPTPNYMSTVLNNAHRTPANIPAGRTTKEAASRQVDASPQTRASRQVDTSPQARGCPILGAGWLRRHQRRVGGVIAATQGVRRSIERSGELTWEDEG